MSEINAIEPTPKVNPDHFTCRLPRAKATVRKAFEDLKAPGYVIYLNKKIEVL